MKFLVNIPYNMHYRLDFGVNQVSLLFIVFALSDFGGKCGNRPCPTLPRYILKFGEVLSVVSNSLQVVAAEWM